MAAEIYVRQAQSHTSEIILGGTHRTVRKWIVVLQRLLVAKGWLAGLGVTAGILGMTGKSKKGNPLLTAGHLLLFPAISSYLAMNFTGSSTYTSPSGVNKEMKKALPYIVGAAAVSTALTLGVHLLSRRKK